MTVDGAFNHADTSALNTAERARTFYRMHPDRDLQTLMARYQQGDFAAATALIDRLSPQLHRFFAAQLASRGDADDLLQETWLRIHSIRHTYRPGEPVLPWLYAVARHIRIDHFRKKIRAASREQHLEEIPDVASEDSGTANEPNLRVMLAPLPESQREVIEMMKVAGMSLEEVARATSSSVGSVKQKVHRAYEKLREHLGKARTAKDDTGGPW